MPDTIALTLAFFFFQGIMFPALKAAQEKTKEIFVFVLFLEAWACAEYLLIKGLFCHFFLGEFETREWIIFFGGITSLFIGLLFNHLHNKFLDKISKSFAS